MLVLLLASGCSMAPPDDAESDRFRADAASVTVTPVELFEGENAKFRPFLGSMSTAFKLRYEGAKPDAHLDVDIWENGRKTGSAGSIGDLFFSGDGDGASSREVEVIVTEPVQPAAGGDMPYQQVKVGVFHHSGSSVASFAVPWDAKRKTRGLLAAPLDSRKLPAEGTVHLWGIQANGGSRIHAADLSPESIAGLEWALVLTLRFEDEGG